ncbi:MAG: hypothetical protein LBS83_02745, partial [Holosporales bacterium]|nr:hypothetical protein [Holosporales bacterium]
MNLVIKLNKLKFMFKEFNKLAVNANSCNTMESRDHLKNGASLKSLMSKKNNLNKILFTFI